jgi:F-type H+-transporting ATPase subunit a
MTLLKKPKHACRYLLTYPTVGTPPPPSDGLATQRTSQAAMAMDPISQFEIHTLGPTVTIGQMQVGITNSAIFMLVSVGASVALLIGTGRQLVPGRIQSVAELSYEFVANTIINTAGEEGMKFFPFVFSLFMFILASNLIGLIPYAFTISSHIIITASLALLVFSTVLVYGFYRNGLKFFGLFVPQGVPIYILPLVVFIEVLSFLSRPVSHAVRLFANMLAGHITLKVFAGFVAMLGAAGAAGWVGALLPLMLTVALTALELLVAFLQAYVFMILTCIYLNDALHPGH